MNKMTKQENEYSITSADVTIESNRSSASISDRLGNIKIGSKLMFAVGVLVFLAAGLTAYSIFSLGELNDSTNKIVNESAEKVRLGARTNQNLLAISRAEKNIILAKTQEDMDGFASVIREEQAEINQRAEKLESLLSAEGKIKYEEFDGAYRQYLTVNEDVRRLARLNSNQRAADLSQNTARESFDQMTAPLQSLAEDLEQRIEQTDDKDVARAAIVAARLVRNLVEMQRAEKNIILATTQKEMDEYAAAINTIRDEVRTRRTRLRDLISGSDIAIVDKFANIFEDWLKLHEEVRSLSRENGNKLAFDLASGKGRELMDTAQAAMKSIVSMNDLEMDSEVVISHETFTSSRIIMIASSIVGIVLAVSLTLYIVFSQITRPLTRIGGAMEIISKGDFTIDVPNLQRGDEVGNMARALQVFKENGLEMEHLRNEQEQQKLRAEEEQRAAMNKMADDFQNSVGHVIGSLSSAATEMQASAETMTATAEQTSTQAGNVAASSDLAATNERPWRRRRKSCPVRSTRSPDRCRRPSRPPQMLSQRRANPSKRCWNW